MKELAWYVLGFASAVTAIAVGLLLAPDAADATEDPGGLLQHLNSAEWADLVVALVFAAIAFVSGSYLSSRAAAAADDAAPAVDLVTAESAG
ncbi:hypothetical protein [Leifsonia sp. 21MFCrub1.1]|uniref:hypothetical protein n=1 Tax=Leifsonia sp. 21MFCrub1.1 TaxID=1798223 RepID=UPI000892A476|nr:hypothetical protein [Leifsonia sp. 21MFCrub1.1]SEA97594.1 hypothetical protein SAMN04515680_2411 [Leifsonia sp. 21MFCrub1.1]